MIFYTEAIWSNPWHSIYNWASKKTRSICNHVRRW